MPDAPPEIRQLSEQLSNQIAAGEVLERPAAAVKELVENSLDAGATRVVIRIVDGGRQLVEVVDDGHGMRPADLRLAVARHATSKLREAEDLFRIATLGFRGEALPSIAAVSEFAIASRPHGAEGGHELRLAGGRDAGEGAVAMAPGSRVSVRNLFWNVPARLKFLKAAAAETGHVADMVQRLALSHPQVAFRLEVDGRIHLDLPAQEALDGRIAALFGRDLAARLIPVATDLGEMELTGYLAHPSEAKPNTRRQFVFLNGRFLRDKLLVAAVREGHQGFLEPRLHATCFLHLTIDPGQVDVNVHPTKSEVRFRREGEVFAFIAKALQAALQEKEGRYALLTPADRAQAPAPAIQARTVVKPAVGAPVMAQAPVVVVQERFLPDAPTVGGGRREAGGAVTPTATAHAAEPAAAYTAPPSPQPPAASHQSAAQRPASATTSHLPPPTSHLPAAARPAEVRRVVQLNRMYLVLETDHGLRIVDQHALHERALLERLGGTVADLGPVQELLVPVMVQLGAAEVATLEPLLPGLAGLGVAAEVFGPTAIAIRSYPELLRRCDWSGFLADVAAEGRDRAERSLRERLAHRAACRAAVKAGQALNDDEQWELVRLLYASERMAHCAHGRPTTLDLGWGELAKRFQR